MYKNLWSSACLEARENVLLLILLPVFDTGSFIALLYLPYSLRVGYSLVRV
ncbi:photosystem II protein V [Iris pallida]|uniref:Photosystem II protein V (Chloroplast) n=1 Tax=Iris pallida TaxID=29817 RepID=A0AAX6IFE9_IRIPA|nr:photosystem II protein V [Iris pallida]